jgi:hypothetical protein
VPKRISVLVTYLLLLTILPVGMGSVALGKPSSQSKSEAESKVLSSFRRFVAMRISISSANDPQDWRRLLGRIDDKTQPPRLEKIEGPAVAAGLKMVGRAMFHGSDRAPKSIRRFWRITFPSFLSGGFEAKVDADTGDVLSVEEYPEG